MKVKGKAFLLLSALASLMASAPAPLPLKDQLSAQILASCQKGDIALKTIREMDGKEESHLFELNCVKEEKKPGVIKIRIADEVALASEYIYDSPYQHEFFQVTVEGNCTFATRLPGKDGKTPLASQIIERDPLNGKILYWESHLLKSNLFVDEEYFLSVFFNDDGTYREHFLRIHTEGKIMGGGINNEIHMEMK